MNRDAASAPAPVAPPEAGGGMGGGPRKTMPCPTCGVENEPKDAFCRMCGAALGSKPAAAQDLCRYCGKPVPEKDAFCPHCGRRHRQPHMPTPPGGMAPVKPAAPAPLPSSRQPTANFSPPSSLPSMPASAPPPAAAPAPAFASFSAPLPAPAPAPPPAAAPASPGQLYFAAPPTASLREQGCTLRILQGHRSGEQFPFTKSITLGRHVGEILFPNDEYLDSRHLVVNTLPDGVILQDMNTVNGTYYLSPGDVEIAPGTFFLVDDNLFQYVEVMPAEWSLVNVWERGVKLMGSLRSERPWGRLLLFSPQGSVAASFLLWQETVALSLCSYSAPSTPSLTGCRLISRKGGVVLSPGDREVYIRVRGQQSFKLPLRLRIGLQIMEIQAS